MRQTLDPRFQELIDAQRPGFTLERPFYTDPEIYRHDLDHVLSPQWHYVDHVSRIPEPGDYIVHDFAEESIVVLRDEHGALQAFFNVCRHRGSRICLQASGNVRRLVCPYHAWAYGLDGSLLNARQMPDHFDPADYPLHRCRVREFEGLIFINLSESSDVSFERLTEDLGSFARPHGLERSKVVHREVYPTYANWKLAVENFRECYHCAPAHPEYTAVNAYVHAGEREMGS